MAKKVNLGIFSFTGDEGCVITLIETLNDYLFKWKDHIHIQYSRALQKNNILKDIDIAIVEGAISAEKEAKRLRQIRKNSKILIALGSCAIDGTPSNHRNFFDEKKMKEIQPMLDKFGLNKTVEPLHKFVKVDDSVPGCPMIDKVFVEKMYKYFSQSGLNVPR
ncbi:MAG: hypothetical protein ABIH52_02845 [Candidatus Aenigmatarchaeota archaeon]|nr:hypothetical protein [Nanoarchaeota archaeon]